MTTPGAATKPPKKGLEYWRTRGVERSQCVGQSRDAPKSPDAVQNLYANRTQVSRARRGGKQNRQDRLGGEHSGQREASLTRAGPTR